MEVVRSIVFGNDSLKKPLRVYDSIILGSDAGGKHKIGSDNIFIGKSTGYDATGNQNIYIGTNTGTNCEGSGNVFIGSCVNLPKANNTLLIGNAITASLITGHTTIQSLDVNGDLCFKGKLVGQLGENLLRKYDTNVGNLKEGSNTITFGEYAGQGNVGNSIVGIGNSACANNRGWSVVALGDKSAMSNMGSYTVALGYEAGSFNEGSNVIAIGQKAAAFNTVPDVIAIGCNAGMSNTVRGSLFIGDFIEGNPGSVTIRKPLSVQSWEIKEGSLSSSNIELTSNVLRFSNTTMNVGDTFSFSKPIEIGKILTPPPFRYIFGDHKHIQHIGSLYYGLSEDGHVYTTKGCGVWTPIRSPVLKHMSKTPDNVLVGWDGSTFFRYTSAGWIPEEREKGEYTLHHMMGNYAIGSCLSNTLYEDKGTLMYRHGTEWELYPGSYEYSMIGIVDWKDSVYFGTQDGIYQINNRKADLLCSIPVTCMGVSPDELFLANGCKLVSLKQEDVWWLSSVHTFDMPILRIFWDEQRWLIHTSEGVFSSPLWKRVHKACEFLSIKPIVSQNTPDISVPSSIRIGSTTLTEKMGGLTVYNGGMSGKVYDTTFNPLPITMNGIHSIHIEKDVCGSLCFYIGSEDGTYSHVSVSAK